MVEFIVMSLFICIGVLICLWIGWWINVPFCATKIKFSAFKQFYSINPNRWSLEDSYVRCQIDDADPYRWRTFGYKRNFYFGFLDYQKYKIFHHKIERNNITEGNMEATAEMLKMVKKDIANMEDIAQRYQKQAVDNLDAILNNLGGTK
jgi:hypothetical protein